MSYTNWKVSKSIIDYSGDDEQKKIQAEIAQREYSAVANWCIDNQQYSIEEDNEYYKVVFSPEPTIEIKTEQVRLIRDSYINNIEWRVDRYKDQKQLNITTTDSEETYIKILRYMQYLRDIPQSPAFPDIEVKTFEQWCEG